VSGVEVPDSRVVPLSAEAVTLVERDAPLALISRALADAGRGRGSVVALEGGYGLGKSSLIDFGLARARREKMIVLEARGREPEQDFAYAVVLQLFEERVARASGGRRRMLLGPARMAAPLFESGPRDIGPERSFSVFHGLYWLCANLAGERPLALIVDDADLADAASLRFLLYLTERIRPLPMALVLSAGSALRCADAAVLREVTQHRATTKLRIAPLTPDGTARCLRRSPLADADQRFCQAVHEATAGNPLMIHALAELLADAGTKPVDGASGLVASSAPPALSAAVLTRIRPLGRSAERLLRAAALLGDSAELRLAAGLAGLELSAAAVAADQLVHAGLLSPAERLTFVHPIVSRAVEADQPPGEHAEAHRRAAQLLADDDAPVEVVAGHLLESTRSGSGWVVDALLEAAADALARGLPADAVRYLSRAFEEPPPRGRRAQVLLELGRAEAAAGNPRAADRLSEAAERLPDPVERARAALESGHMLFALGRPDEASDAFASRLEDLQAETTAVRARLDAALAAVSQLEAMRSGVPARPERPAPPEDTPAARAELAQRALEGALRGDARDEVRDLAERALARGALLDDTAADGISYYLAVAALTLAEELQTSELALTAALEEARSRGSTLGVATASAFRSFAILRRGRVGEAAADARIALAKEQQGWRLGGSGARWVLCEAALELDEIEAAERVVEESLRGAARGSAAWLAALAGRGRLALAQGRGEAAFEAFAECGDGLESLGVTNPALIPWRSAAGLAASVLGDRSEALRLVEAELAVAERFGAGGAISRALRALGAVKTGEGALEAFEEAVRRTETSQAALERAKALVFYGAALRRSGRRRDAREPLRQGLLVAEGCGALGLVKFAKSETMAAGARPRRRALQGLESLTPREHQVAVLAAEGKSNREIAEMLFVTVKTVEWHLKHAYTKLGVGSRRDLPRVVLDAGD